jgi:hypothetical protein
MNLSDDDKQWIRELLQQSLQQLLQQSLQQFFQAELTKLKEYIDERMHDAETRLLRRFADYNASADVRFRKLEADASNLNTSSTLRLGELERQLGDLRAKVILLEGRLPHQ